MLLSAILNLCAILRLHFFCVFYHFTFGKHYSEEKGCGVAVMTCWTCLTCFFCSWIKTTWKSINRVNIRMAGKYCTQSKNSGVQQSCSIWNVPNLRCVWPWGTWHVEQWGLIAVEKDYFDNEVVDLERAGTLCLLVLYYTNVARYNTRFTVENSLPRADCHISHTGNSTERWRKLSPHSPDLEKRGWYVHNCMAEDKQSSTD